MHSPANALLEHGLPAVGSGMAMEPSSSLCTTALVNRSSSTESTACRYAASEWPRDVMKSVDRREDGLSACFEGNSGSLAARLLLSLPSSASKRLLNASSSL